MIYEDENNTREKLFEFRKTNICAVCKGGLDVFLDADLGKAFLACRNDRSHQGILRIYEPTPFEEKGYEAFNIPTRREMMSEELGTGKATKLVKYVGVVSLTREQAMEILSTIWPDAPEVEVLKAAMICHQYGLNPLMKHVFLIPFKRRKGGQVVGEDWVAVLGIKANRLIAHRAGDYSYLDDTPRIMTAQEQERIFGEVDDSKVWAITKLRDSKGNEAPGYGPWPLDEVPYGAEKGNTKTNMAFIRSERNALDRLFAGEMPQGVEVIDEEYASGQILEGEAVGEPPKGGGKSGEQAENESGEGKPGTAVLSPPEARTEATPAAQKPKRDLNTIKTFGDLYQACLDDFNMDRQAVWDELGVSSQIDIVETPRECYQRIAAARQ